MGTSNITYPNGDGDELGKVWIKRIKTNTEKYYRRWESNFKCAKLEKYYQGDQWEPTGTNYEPYTINLIFSTIEIKLPTLLFQEPVYHIKPKPSDQLDYYDFDAATKSAQLREDALNTFVSNHILNFAETVQLAILDAFFRFGIIETGYSANWIQNPNAGKPILRSDSKPFIDPKSNNIVRQPDVIPASEQIYVKRIHASRFRMSGLQVGTALEHTNWCGYWEYARVEDLIANKKLKNTDKLNWSGIRSTDFVDEDYTLAMNSDFMKSGDLTKVWHIWNNRNKKRYLFHEDQSLTLFEEDFKRLPLHGLRFHPLTEGWLPMPPVVNWKSPQDEYNEAREQSRNHRKRFIRKFLYNVTQFPSEEEIDKLINGGDGTFAAVNGDTSTAVKPVDNADLGMASATGMTVTKDDFNIVSGTSSEERGQADRTTATQANITNQKAAIRDSKSRMVVASWLKDIGRELLLTAEEKMVNPVWIKMPVTQDPEMGSMMDEVEEIWHKVSFQDLHENREYDNLDYQVGITLDSLSPIESDVEKQAFLLFLAVCRQYPEIASDPTLIREAAYRCGYRNEKIIRKMQAAAQMMLAQQLAAQQAQNSPAAGQGANGTIQNQTPPALNEIANQLSNQLGGTVQ